MRSEDTTPLVMQKLTNYNWRLLDARRSKGYSQKDLSLLTGIRINRISAYERLLDYPSEDEVSELAAALQKPGKHLFPEILQDISERRLGQARTRLIGEQKLLAYRDIEVGLLETGPEQEESLIRSNSFSAVYRNFHLLNRRENDVVKRRFGLPPYKRPQTLEEIAKIYSRGPERIRQIEAKALRKLRNAGQGKGIQAY